MLGAVIAVIAGFVVLAVITWTRGAVAAGEGDCVKVSSAQDAQAERVDCGTREAAYRVGKKLENTSARCPEGDYTTWTGGDTKLCLVLNAKQGDCFRSGPDRAAERVDCGAAADIEILKVVTGRVDKAECAEGNLFATYAEPPTTVCMTTP